MTRPPPPSPTPPLWQINFVCTDRGQHKKPRMVSWGRQVTDRPDDGDSYTLRCRHCGRAPRISASDWPRLFADYESTRRNELDISLLR